MDQELCLVWLYCLIDEALRSMVRTGRLRTRGPEPELTAPRSSPCRSGARYVDWRATPRSGVMRQPSCENGSRAWAPNGTSCAGVATSRACRSGC